MASLYRVIKPASEMQIDLMETAQVDSMGQDGRAVTLSTMRARRLVLR